MDSITLMSVLKVLGEFGTVGLIIFLWWADNRRFQGLLDQYKADMNEQREMYKSNVSLVKKSLEVSADLRDVVILNTQVMQTLCDEIRQNEYCPATRINKKKAYIAGGTDPS